MDGANLPHSVEPSEPRKPEPTEQVSSKTPAQPVSTPQTPAPDSASKEQPFLFDTNLPVDDVEPVTWSASEFIAHEKSFTWYVVLGVVTVIVAAFIFLFTRDVISTAVIVVVAIVLGYAATRKPRTLPYKLDGEGLTIAEKFYPYNQFRSFAVTDQGPFSSIVFMPLKRFMTLIEIYYEPKDEERIVNLLSERLPLETHTLDPVDRFMRHIRF
jgi:hypothetical protein